MRYASLILIFLLLIASASVEDAPVMAAVQANISPTIHRAMSAPGSIDREYVADFLARATTTPITRVTAVIDFYAGGTPIVAQAYTPTPTPSDVQILIAPRGSNIIVYTATASPTAYLLTNTPAPTASATMTPTISPTPTMTPSATPTPSPLPTLTPNCAFEYGGVRIPAWCTSPMP